jgi:hypothetical protein
MQELYDTVRATGANNLVIAGGLGYAFDLSGVGTSPIKGYNIMYASHPYKPQDPASAWQSMFGYLATSDIAPVILTEFGDTGSQCTGDWDTQLIKFADAAHISWTAWAWYPAGCSFPALISDWQHTPTVQGVAVKAALMAYPYLPPANLGGGGDGGALNSGGAGGTGSSEGGVGGASSAGASSTNGGAGGASGASAVQ